MFLYVCDDSLAPSASMPFPLMQVSGILLKVKYAYTLSIFESPFIWLMMMTLLHLQKFLPGRSFSTLMPYIFFVQ